MVNTAYGEGRKEEMVLIVEMNEFLEVFGVDVFNRFSIVVYIVNVG